jgi:phosphopentomutase
MLVIAINAVLTACKICSIFILLCITDGKISLLLLRSPVIPDRDFCGLCFVNLVDFDTAFGHRRDVDGYADALSEFDSWLGGFVKNLRGDDMVMITADHGCDPSYTATSDHTREYVPLLVLGKGVKPVDLGTRRSFADIAATVTELLGVPYENPGKSFAKDIL